MRLTALLPPPPTPITSMRADWLGTMPWVVGEDWLIGSCEREATTTESPRGRLPLAEALSWSFALACSMAEGDPLCCGCIVSSDRASGIYLENTLALLCKRCNARCSRAGKGSGLDLQRARQADFRLLRVAEVDRLECPAVELRRQRLEQVLQDLNPPHQPSINWSKPNGPQAGGIKPEASARFKSDREQGRTQLGPSTQ